MSYALLGWSKDLLAPCPYNVTELDMRPWNWWPGFSVGSTIKWPQVGTHTDMTLDLFLFWVLLFYAIATMFQLYHGGHMMYEIKEKARAYTFTDSMDL